MNTSHLKKFAQEARRKLLEQVGAKLNFVLTTDSAELREKTEQLKQLRQELGRTTKEQLIEKVAYTWFNRLMALRFMDVNDYQPLGIRIITPKDNYTIPEILDEAKRGNIPEELKVHRQKIYDLLDNKIPSTNPQNEAYKELLIATCNHLSTTFPFLFEKINDYTELLLPDDLTSDFSIVKDVRDGMLIEDCKNVEIIGWLYQFYISEKKDEVFASKSKVKKEDIPAATQLFTPRWIVEYMVQNTLGKLWLQNRPKSRLREHMQYFIESASHEAGDYLKINSPEEIKFLDPASGSGHILVYAFDLFTKIYEEEGYNTSEIPQLIIESNLYGFEIDERAAQLSALALMMKAREYNRRLFHKKLNPNILCFKEVANDEVKELLSQLQINVSVELMHDLLLMQQATNFGSLILPHAGLIEINHATEKVIQSLPNTDVFKRDKVQAITNSLEHLQQLAVKFHCIVANPPYMGGGSMNLALSEFVKTEYPKSKADLMTCFMSNAHKRLYNNGYLGMINLPSWMFLSSFEDFRIELIRIFRIESLLHLGRGIFGSDFGSVTFSLQKKESVQGDSIFRRLFDKHVQVRSVDTIRKLFLNPTYGRFVADQRNFEKIPNVPIGYWLSKDVLNVFTSNRQVNDVADCKQGLATSDNDRFRRYWHEVSLRNSSLNNGTKWFPYNSGGDYRKWYGNQSYFVNWENDGYEIKNCYDSKGKLKSRPQNINYYFKESLSWSKVTAAGFALRYFPEGFIFDVAGCSIFASENKTLLKISAELNSKLKNTLVENIAPTINYEVGQISKTPFIDTIDDRLIDIARSNTEISKQEWDSKENSWSFCKNELLKIYNDSKLTIEELYDSYVQKWTRKFLLLHKQEEELSYELIQNNNLRNSITPDIDLNDITILSDECDRQILKKLNKELIRDPQTLHVINYTNISLPFISSEVFSQFISYSVGCMFGRYSLDKEGLILANEGETLENYLYKIDKTKKECAFLPDGDNIIPVLEEDWFEDDIVGKFCHFLNVTFGENNFNKNLAFIEEHIGKDIRKYFIKDFYPDHIKRYKKRPIYWMFSSPKGSFNVLIYMHRYTPDTVSNILNKYLKEFIGKLNTRREHLERVKETGSASDKVRAIKESDNIQKMLVELHEYERDILYPLATERIKIDLDDGVLVNYNKFGKAVKEVNGLNDPATKKKVKQFDWIDTTQIR